MVHQVQVEQTQPAQSRGQVGILGGNPVIGAAHVVEDTVGREADADPPGTDGSDQRRSDL